MTRVATDTRIQRCRRQSLQLLEASAEEIQKGRWLRSEELLWGSLTLAVKGVALSRGDAVENDAAVKAYIVHLGHELRDRRVREAFDRLSSLSVLLEGVHESRRRVNRLIYAVDDLSATIERLWDLVDAIEFTQERLDD